MPYQEPYSSDSDVVANALGSDIVTGLSRDEVQRRLHRYGHNALDNEHRSPVLGILYRQIRSPVVYVLLVAAGISFATGDRADAVAITIVLVINTTIGFLLEMRAQRSMKALRKLRVLHALVCREGIITRVEGHTIVPGDIVVLEAGDVVPADGRIVRSTELSIDESVLTGESLPSDKSVVPAEVDAVLAERTSMAYSGTHVVRGNGRVLIVATGMDTEVGRIAHMTESAQARESPLFVDLQAISRTVTIATAIVAGIVLIGGSIAGQELVALAPVVLALCVAAIPEGLPIVSTIALGRGMLAMSKQKVIVKDLSSVEAIGTVDVVCTDKTGTLTRNEITVDRVVTAGGAYGPDDPAVRKDDDARRILVAASLCNDATVVDGVLSGDALDCAILEAAGQAGLDIMACNIRTPRIETVPFSSERKLMATLHSVHDGTYITYAKGATEELLRLCAVSISDAERAMWWRLENEYAAQGMRVLGVASGAYDEVPGDIVEELRMLGLICMSDPIRPDVPAAIAACHRAGIRVIMITGDHAATALNIGRRLELTTSDKVVTGIEMDRGDGDLMRDANIFARVSPKHKLDLVTRLQEDGHRVVMTGDGVNDAPAIQKADVGIAMGIKGTAIAQDIADMVVQDDSFSSIVAAIRLGRILYDNIRLSISYLLAGNVAEIIAIGISVIMRSSFQLIPMQILFINLMSDVLPALALGFTQSGKYVMRDRPRLAHEKLIPYSQWIVITLDGAIIACACLGAVYCVAPNPDVAENSRVLNNVFFFTLVIAQFLHVFNAGIRPTTLVAIAKNMYVWAALAVNTAVMFTIYRFEITRRTLNATELGWQEWLVVILFAVCSFVVNLGIHAILSNRRTGKGREGRA